MMQTDYKPTCSNDIEADSAEDLYKVYYRFYQRMKEERNVELTNSPFIPMRIQKLVIETFNNGVLKESENPSSLISAFILRLIKEQRSAGKGCCFVVPSIIDLANFFGIYQTEIRRAFWKLRMQGYDFMIPKDGGNITLWSHP